MLVVAVEDDLDWENAWPTLGWPLDAKMRWTEEEEAADDDDDDWDDDDW